MSPGGPIRVLVIDDSAFSRQAITRMLEASGLAEVVGTARDGEEALRKTFELGPDLITLDLEMPGMDGFTFLRLVMSRRPTPVIVISGRGAEGDVWKALELGAVDFIAKPMRRATLLLASIERELIRKVHAMRELRIDRVRDRIAGKAAASEARSGRELLWSSAELLWSSAKPSEVPDGRLIAGRQPAGLAAPLGAPGPACGDAPRVVALGASTGGPAALIGILGAFAEAPPCAFLVAQHMPEGFTAGFAARLDRLTALAAREARGGEEPEPGSVLVAPGGRHLELEVVRGRALTRVVAVEEGDPYAPSVDRLFESCAKAYGADLLAIVLTGMGDDGRRGVLAVKQSGGRVIAESEETAVIPGMPQQAIRTGAVDEVVPLSGMADAILRGARPGLPAAKGKGCR